jgi:hypothetical protein
MAAILVTTIKRFIGTAAEMAALSVVGVPTGSTFFQTDTGFMYTLSSAGTWAIEKIIGDVNLQVNDVDVSAANPVPTQLTGSNVKKAFTITPNDSVDLPVNALSLTCVTDGIAYVDFIDGGTNIPIQLSAGYWNPVNVKRVRATNTTATGIMGQES